MMKYLYSILLLIIIIPISMLMIDIEGEVYVEDIITIYQELDNSDDFDNWIFVGESSTVEGNYIKMIVDEVDDGNVNVYVYLEEAENYTLMYEIIDYNISTSFRMGDIFNTIVLEDNIGVYSVLINPIDDNGLMSFSIHSGEVGDYVIFRAVLFEGDYTDLTDSDLQDLINNAEYGNYELDNSYIGIGMLPIEGRIEDIIIIISSLIGLSVILVVGLSIFKKK